MGFKWMMKIKIWVKEKKYNFFRFFLNMHNYAKYAKMLSFKGGER